MKLRSLEAGCYIWRIWLGVWRKRQVQYQLEESVASGEVPRQKDRHGRARCTARELAQT